MAALSPSEVSDCASPTLDVFFSDADDNLLDVASLEYEIFELVSVPGVPTKIFPTVGRATVDLNPCPTGQRVSLGRYVALYTVPAASLIGTHMIRWYFRLTLTSPEQTSEEEFEILDPSAPAAGPDYTSIANLRAEGVTVAQADDARLATLIARVSRMIDFWTGRSFSVSAKILTIDGAGRPGLLLEEPIVDITEVLILNSDPFTNDFATVDFDDLRIYNRHLTENLIDPDDRDNPRIEFFHSETRYDNTGFVSRSHFELHHWPIGVRNIQLTGSFGYREYDGTAQGRVPLMITHAANLMVIRELPLLAEDEDRADIRSRGRITKVKTRDQEIAYGAQSTVRPAHQAGGFFTGDPEIDSILAMHVRPPHFGAV